MLVLVGLREAIMNAVPLALKRAIGVGIGLFILFIGFANGGFIKAGSGTLVTIQFPTTHRPVRVHRGLAITIVLYVAQGARRAAREHPADDASSPCSSASAKLPETFTATPDFSTLGQVRPRAGVRDARRR